MSGRILRSASHRPPSTSQCATTTDSLNTALNTSRKLSPVLVDDNAKVIPLSSELPGLNYQELKLLREKQNQLAMTTSSTLESLPAPHLRAALEATLIFAQYEAGTAVCVDPTGWVLTCSHCFGETQSEWESGRRKWLLSYTGRALQVECRVWDPKRDLALAKIVTVEASEGTASGMKGFEFIQLESTPPSGRVPIVCIGQPGRDDLETTSRKRTKYNLVEVSKGKLCGMMKGKDPQDNAEIGTLMHDAWTYWGHSGAPLVRANNGRLLGLHSSWDDTTCMRHGIPFGAIEAFLVENRRIIENGSPAVKAYRAEDDHGP